MEESTHISPDTMLSWLVESGVSPEEASEIVEALREQHEDGREDYVRSRAAYPSDFGLYAPARFHQEDEEGWRKSAADAAEYVSRRLAEG